MHIRFLSLILLFLFSRFYLFPFDTRLPPSLLYDHPILLQEVCVLSTENPSGQSKHTVMIYFWKKHTVQRENYEPTVSYVIYTEVSYKSLYIPEGSV